MGWVGTATMNNLRGCRHMPSEFFCKRFDELTIENVNPDKQQLLQPAPDFKGRPCKCDVSRMLSWSYTVLSEITGGLNRVTQWPSDTLRVSS